MDVLTPEQRRRNMQRIKSKNTRIEVMLRKALWEKGYRYRKNYNELPGKPDIVLTKYKIAIFCDSEFFHGKDWQVLKPRLEQGNNSEFWINKISRNIERDNEINKRLLSEGWAVIRFWGNDIKKHTDECVKVIEETIFELEMGDDIYTYEGIRKMSFEEVVTRHREDTLVGCLKLYSDNTECYIEDYAWKDIVNHIDSGGEIGYEC